jgi:hypothetical protein
MEEAQNGWTWTWTTLPEMQSEEVPYLQPEAVVLEDSFLEQLVRIFLKSQFCLVVNNYYDALLYYGSLGYVYYVF